MQNLYNSTKPLKTLIKQLELTWPVFIGYFILYYIKFLPEILMPLYLKRVYAFASSPSDYTLQWFVFLNVIFFVIVVQNIFTHSLFVRLVHSRVRKMEHNLRSALIRRLQQLSIAFHTRTQSGRLQSKVLRDVDDVSNMTIQLFHQGFASIIAIVWCLVVTFTSDWIVGLFFIVVAPLTALVITRFRKRMSRNNNEYRLKIERMSSRVSEMIHSIPIARAHGIEEEEIKKTNRDFDQVYDAAVQLDYTNQMFGASSWVSMRISIVCIMMVCGFLAWAGLMSVENIILYYGLFQIIVGSFSTMLSFMPIINRGLEALRSLGEVLESPDLELNKGKLIVDSTEGSVVFDNVRFSYDQRKKAVEGFSAEIEAGQCVAFVGESGSGKSTLMNLLIGFWRPDEGRILLDGKDYENLDLRSWRKHLAVVPQNTILFTGTILENITYGRQDLSAEKIDEAIEAANLKDFIAKLPDGLKTVIRENGSNLSGGQRQRISIARALVRDPRIIILDEATSALDVLSEKEVQGAIDNLVKGRTTFIVAHRLSTIRQADRVFVMKEGRCIEEGSQDELLRNNGEFARLKALQV